MDLQKTMFWCMGGLVTVRGCVSNSLAEPDTELSCTWRDDNNSGCFEPPAYRPWEFPFPSPLPLQKWVSKHGFCGASGEGEVGNSPVTPLLAALTHVYHFCKGRGKGEFPGSLPPVPYLEFLPCRSSIMERGGGGWSSLSIL